MRFESVVLFASSAAALSFPDITSILPLFARDKGSGSSGSGKGTGCPAVWSQVSQQLTSDFLSDGQCNPLARSAIRLIFHDCGSK
jgi:hypothetical protein